MRNRPHVDRGQNRFAQNPTLEQMPQRPHRVIVAHVLVDLEQNAGSAHSSTSARASPKASASGFCARMPRTLPATRKDTPDHPRLLGGRDRDVDDLDRRFLEHRLERWKNARNPPCVGDLARAIMRSRGDSHHGEPGLGIGHKMTVADDESRTHHADSHVATRRP